MNDLSVSLRPVEAGDQRFLVELFASTRWEQMQLTGWPEEQIRLFLRQQFDFQTQDWNRNYPNASRQLILVGGQPAGRLYRNRQSQESDLRVVDLALLPACRNQGIGTRLLRETIQSARAEGWKTSLHVELHNPARRLYERLGFHPVREHGCYLLMECPPAGPEAVGPVAGELARQTA